MTAWISVNQRLPDPTIEVLCKIHKDPGDRNDQVVASLEPSDGAFEFMESWGGDFLADMGWAVTHWMPLPNPPEEL